MRLEVECKPSEAGPSSPPGPQLLATFRVRDTGIGMTTADQGRLFTDYHQIYHDTRTDEAKETARAEAQHTAERETSSTPVDTPENYTQNTPSPQEAEEKRSIHGTGLGLAVSLSLAEAMRGNIEVESEPGQGSTFSLTVPTREVSPDSASRVPRTLSVDLVKHLRVLLVDDNKINRRTGMHMLMKVAKGSGRDTECARRDPESTEAATTPDLTVRWQPGLKAPDDTGPPQHEAAEGGLQALERVTQEPTGFQVILMDLNMPGWSGYQTTERLRQVPGFDPKKTVVVALTADVLATREKCAAHGMQFVLHKPLQFKNLVGMLHQCKRELSSHEPT